MPVEQRYTVRKIRLKLIPRTFVPKEVKNVRAALGISQPVFSQFLGVDVKTVRSWEQGQRAPSGMACRFLEEIEADLEHWRGGSGMCSSSRMALGKKHDNLATSGPIDLLPRRPRITSGRRVARAISPAVRGGKKGRH